MKAKSSVQSAATAAIAFCALFFSQATFASNLGWTPRGSHVDADPMRDLPSRVGEQITFDVSFLILGAPNALTDIIYTLHYDPTELRGLRYEGGPNFFTGRQGTLGGTEGSIILVHEGGIYNNRPFIDYFTFETLSGIKNDGMSDVWISLNSHNDVGAPIATMQVLDVQPIPEPGSLLLMAAGLGVIAWKARRRNEKALTLTT